MFIDTHCHIHEANYPLDIGDTITRAHHAGVSDMICVGTSVQSSKEALAFTTRHENMFASIGVHPHDTKDGLKGLKELAAQGEPKLVAVGEIGLDYFYTHSPREVQIKALEAQIDLALRHNLPIIFHVRDAFDDFWPIFDNFHGIHGVLHSFTDTTQNMEQGIRRGLFIGVNGISTFTKDSLQQQMFASIPLKNMLLETDAPFLTPVPLRGRINEPAFVRNVAKHHATIRDISLEEIASKTTANARALFALS
jgi:TatD DNase family protein